MSDIHGVKLPSGDVFDIKDAYAREHLKSDYVTPQMFGAKADGETDDFDAFSKMLSSNPKYVYIPQGTYYISKSLKISNGIHVIKGAGVGVTTIKCGNGFIDSGSDVVYRLFVSGMSIISNVDKMGAAISGKYCYCHFSELYIEHFEKGFCSTQHSWINSFDKCEIVYCKYGIRSDGDNFNNIILNECSLQYNEYGFYMDRDGKQISFSGCDIELNTVGFHTQSTSAFVIRDSYLEKNNILFEVVNWCYGGDITLKNNMIYSDIERSGWLATLPTWNEGGVPFMTFNLEECYVRHVSPDYPPFAFNEPNEYSHVCVNIHSCRFYHRPDTYLDLFDRTNCVNYGNAWNRLPIDTDLIYYKNGDLRWYCRNGNTYDASRRDTLFEVIGTYPGYSATSDRFAVAISAEVGKLSGDALLGGTIQIENVDGETVTGFLSETDSGALRFSVGSDHTFTKDSIAHIHIKY